MTPSSGERGAGARAGAGVLFLDLEGGWGGSSRSMFHLIEHLDRERFRPFAVLRRAGPVLARYQALGIPHLVMPALPAFRPAERKNALAYALYRWDGRRMGRTLAHLEACKRTHGLALVHVNHESLALAGRRVARHLGLPWVCHVRTLLKPGYFARQVYRTIAREASRVVFITERNRDHFAELAGRAFAPERGAVVYNIAPMSNNAAPLSALLAEPAALRVVSLTNFSPNRGVDRIVDVAAALARRGRRDIVFYLCGRLANVRRLPGARNRYLDSILARVRAQGLEEAVRFPGHLPEPERALAAADALIKLTREANPWGRDIIEALAAGKPVIALGDYARFVAPGENGYLSPRFEPEEIADYLETLADDASLRARIAGANRAKARALFDGRARAREIEAIYEKVLGPCG